MTYICKYSYKLLLMPKCYFSFVPYCGEDEDIANEDAEGQGRERRSIDPVYVNPDKQRYCVKILVIVDEEMVQKHAEALKMRDSRGSSSSRSQEAVTFTGTIVNVVSTSCLDRNYYSYTYHYDVIASTTITS